MRILLTVLEIQDIGGIAQDIDWKIRGLERAGHKVDIIMLRKIDAEPKMRGRTTQVGWTEGPNGLQLHPKAGFYNLPIWGYGSKLRIKKLHRLFNKYDGIIHEIPGPNPVLTMDVEGYWKMIYKHDVPQIISAHDANFRLMYPHLIDIAEYIQGISCTNQAGYAALEWFPAPRAFIGAPHPVYNWKKQMDWEQRRKRAISAHVWKAWKHHHMQVEAGPLLKKSFIHLYGSGIEYHYMTSENKRKPKYGDIWERAMDSGRVKYKGMVSTPELAAVYQSSRVTLDTSFSEKFLKLGCHFNRSIIEGYNSGCVPIVLSENMLEDKFQRRLFVEGKTHFELPANHKPKELAQLIDHVANLSSAEANRIVGNGRKILKRFFDYRVTSLEFLKLLEGKPAGVYPKLETGKINKQIKANRDKFLSKIEQRIDKVANRQAANKQ